MDSKALKKDLRTQYIAKRKGFTRDEITKKSKAIAQHFLSSEFISLSTFHIYISIDKFNEIETQHIIQPLWEKNKIVVVPKMKGKQLLNCHYTANTELSKNSWSILEPVKCEMIDHHQIDVVLVPMLISDLQGNRIGYGGGFYDRFLPQLRDDCKLVGINFFEPETKIESQPHDVPLDFLITPNGIIEINKYP